MIITPPLSQSDYGILIVIAVLSYLVGSIPFGLLLTKIAGLGDIRKIGSGNIGATNVLRTGHKGLALLTLLLDGGKGALVYALAVPIGRHSQDVAALFVMLGHLFPMWLKFKGGKGVATSVGVLFALNFYLGLATTAVWLLIAKITKYSSLASLVAGILAPFMAFLLCPMDEAYEQTLLVALLAILVIARHQANIGRLTQGTEPKIGAKDRTEPSAGG